MTHAWPDTDHYWRADYLKDGVPTLHCSVVDCPRGWYASVVDARQAENDHQGASELFGQFVPSSALGKATIAAILPTLLYSKLLPIHPLTEWRKVLPGEPPA